MRLISWGEWRCRVQKDLTEAGNVAENSIVLREEIEQGREKEREGAREREREKERTRQNEQEKDYIWHVLFSCINFIPTSP